jgi:hypothetical protein
VPTLPVVGHNFFGFDYHLFARYGWKFQTVVGDTLRMHRLINTHDDAEHGLKSLIRWWLPELKVVGDFEELFSRRKCLGIEEAEPKVTRRKVGADTVRSLVGGPRSRLAAGSETIPLDRVPEEYPGLLHTLVQYSALDAVATLRLYELFDAKLKETPWCTPLHETSTPSGTTHAE